MMIAIGDKHFIDSEYIVEILRPVDRRANIITNTAAREKRLINTTGGQKIRSIIKLKSKHIVLCALEVKALKSKIGKTILSAEPGNKYILGPQLKKEYAQESKPANIGDRRIEPDRRHFSYTHHIPERRKGTDRRIKNGNFQPGGKFK